MNRQILRLAIPNILSNLTVPLLSSVDTALVGRLDDTHFLGAVAVGSAMFSFIYWGFGFLRMGTTGLTAQAFGEKNQPEMSLILARALVVAGISALLLMAVQVPAAKLSFYLIDASTDVEHFASRYFYIRMTAAPATLALFVLNGWFLGMQNAKFPLYLSVFVNLTNIVFSVIFVRFFAMNSDGVALGTVCAQYLSLIAGLFLLFRGYQPDWRSVSRSAIFKSETFRRYLQINRDIFIRTICLVFALAYFTAQSAEFGDDLLAVNTILMQLLLILAYGTDGFAFAAESLIGKFIGERNRKSLREVIRLSFFWSMGLGAITSCFYYIFYLDLIFIFTDKTHLADLAMPFIGWVAIAPLINGFSYIWDGIFIGATDGKALRKAMLICTFIFYLPVYWLFRDVLGNHALWLAMTIFMLARGVSLWIYAKFRMRIWLSTAGDN